MLKKFLLFLLFLLIVNSASAENWQFKICKNIIEIYDLCSQADDCLEIAKINYEAAIESFLKAGFDRQTSMEIAKTFTEACYSVCMYPDIYWQQREKIFKYCIFKLSN